MILYVYIKGSGPFHPCLSPSRFLRPHSFSELATSRVVVAHLEGEILGERLGKNHGKSRLNIDWVIQKPKKCRRNQNLQPTSNLCKVLWSFLFLLSPEAYPGGAPIKRDTLCGSENSLMSRRIMAWPALLHDFSMFCPAPRDLWIRALWENYGKLNNMHHIADPCFYGLLCDTGADPSETLQNQCGPQD